MSERPTTVAYLVNQYPKVSHSFVRREIHALEAHGVEVHRFSIRSCADELVDSQDIAEHDKTRFILGNGLAALLGATVKTAVTRPAAFWQAFGHACRMGLRSERGLVVHWAYLMEACLLLHWLMQVSVDHVHAHFGTNSTTVAMLCRMLGGPTYSFTAHGPEEFDDPLGIALPEKIMRAAFVVAISSYGKSQLCRWCDYRYWGKIRIIHCGLDAAFLDADAVKPMPRYPKLVCVGRLAEQKGHLLLVEAIDRLLDRGCKLDVVLIGDGHLREPVMMAIDRYGLEDCVHITGWADSDTVRQHIQDAQVLVLPSFAEGLPVVIMEALAVGRPVISTYVAGIPELVGDGDCGWLVPAGSVEALTDAINEALDTPLDTLTEMGHEGRRRVCRDHDAAIEGGRLAEYFTAIANQVSASISNPILPS
ncbi:MAG: glycosyltransferase [Cyanobacteria bacterium J06597_1]